jgi:threonine dehydratase
MTAAVTFADVLVAADRIRGLVHSTPVLRSSTIDAELGATVFFKCENLQKVGAFKARGATNAIFSLDPETAAAGVVTHSSGNHGQAVAYAAAMRSIPAWVVMPDDASPVKAEAVAGYGATVVRCPRAERETTARRLADETGATLVHPFDDPAVIAGQGTAALELLEQVDGLDVLVAPVGGGGLLSGTAIAASAIAPEVSIVGAEPAAADDAFRSMLSGTRQPAVPHPVTMCDGLLTALGELTFPILLRHGVSVVLVEEEAVAAACTTFLSTMKIVVEPSGATVLAAMRSHPDRFAGRRVGAIVSGGNTDLAWLRG